MQPEIISPLGVALYATPAEGEELAGLESELAEASRALETNPNDVENIIMYGRRLAYLWRYHEAIQVFSDGIARFPENAMLYRHRGHRYISIRQFAQAEADLERADRLMPDQFDILYHLGLARWLQGDYNRALPAYRHCLEVSTTDESRVASAYWLYFTLMRTGHREEAQQLAANLQAQEAGDNRHYLHLLLMFRGERTEEDLRAMMEESPLTDSLIGYGLGLWHLLHGRHVQAEKYFRLAIKGIYWPSFGYIASEVELQKHR